MILKCQKCGFENEIGVIFCRRCGEKLDTNAISPEKIESGAKKTIGLRWIRPAVSIAILLGIALLCWKIFAPKNVPPYTESKASCTAAKRSLERNRDTVFTPEQLTALFNKDILADSGAKSGMYTIQHVMFQGEGDILSILVYSSVGKLPVVFTFSGELEKADTENEEDKIDFKLRSVKAGDLPVAISSMQEMLLHKFDDALRCKAVRDVFAAAGNVEFSDGVLKITFGDKK